MGGLKLAAAALAVAALSVAAPAIADPTPDTPAAASTAPASAAPTTPPAAPPAAAIAPTPPPCCQVAVGTPVVVELVDHVSTKIQKSGDKFALRLAEPLVVDGMVVLRAGALGEGEVIDSEPPGMGGKAAKLVLAARFVDQDGVHVPLRSLKLSGGGQNYTDASMIASEAFGPLGLAVHGGNVDYPPGTRANAKVAADLTLQPLGPAGAAASQPPAASAAATPPTPPTTPANDGKTP